MDISLSGVGRDSGQRVGVVDRRGNSGAGAVFGDMLERRRADMDAEIKAVKASREKPETKRMAVALIEEFGKSSDGMAADEAIIEAKNKEMLAALKTR